MKVMCPICEQPAVRTITKWGDRNDCCGLWSWGDKKLVDAETHAARKAAHEAFDALWQSGAMTRSQAYQALRHELRVSENSCHMATMSKEMAARVPAAVLRIQAGRLHFS